MRPALMDLPNFLMHIIISVAYGMSCNMTTQQSICMLRKVYTTHGHKRFIHKFK